MLAGPKLDEAEDLIGLFALADVGVGVAEDIAVGVLGEKDQDAGLAAAALGKIVGLNEGMLTKVRYRVEIEIEGLALKNAFAAELSVPGAKQLCDLLRRDARGVLGQETLLRDSIEPAEEAKPFIGDQCHDVAFALDRPQLEGECGKQPLERRDHLRARQLGTLGERLGIQAHEIGDEQEQTADAGGELTWGKREDAHVSNRLNGWADAGGTLLIEAARQASKALLEEDLAHRGGAQRRSLFFERPTDVVDGVVALPELHDLVADLALLGLLARTPPPHGEEISQSPATKVITEHTERCGRIAEAARHLC